MLYELLEQAVFMCLDAPHLQKFKAPVVVRYLEIYLVATGLARRYAGSREPRYRHPEDLSRLIGPVCIPAPPGDVAPCSNRPVGGQCPDRRLSTRSNGYRPMPPASCPFAGGRGVSR